MNAHQGVKRHIEVESVERLAKWLKSIGWNAQDAQRGAVQISLVLCGDYSRADAREAAIEITATQRTTAGVTPAESIETHHHRT